MTLFEILLLSASLSVDSFAVSMGGSVSLGRPSAGKTLSVAAVFGTVQSMFLFAGWAAGYSVVSYISPAAHVLAFVILAYIGGSMLFSAFRNDEGRGVDIAGTKRLLAAAVASSIDAAAVGVSLAMADTDFNTSLILTLVLLVVTMIFSIAGIHTGAAAGRKFGRPARIAGGIILILIGCKPFIEHFLHR